LEHGQVPDRKNIGDIHHPYPVTDWMMNCPDYDRRGHPSITDEGVTSGTIDIKFLLLGHFLEN
jgi:hypothetical protein